MKGISLWVEFLIYTSFAISVLSIVLYYVHLTILNQQAQINLKYTVNLLTDLNYQIDMIGSCYSCTYKFQQNIPNGLTVYIFNGTIESLYISPINYSLSVPSYINLNITQLPSNNFLYNFTMNTIPFNIISNNYTFYGNDICLILNKTTSGFFVYKC
ncbi:MAG: hypothetical protein ACP5GJ_01805 [Nanopusillaceae archaeon]